LIAAIEYFIDGYNERSELVCTNRLPTKSSPQLALRRMMGTFSRREAVGPGAMIAVMDESRHVGDTLQLDAGTSSPTRPRQPND
jgi:hypothetical protein